MKEYILVSQGRRVVRTGSLSEVEKEREYRQGAEFKHAIFRKNEKGILAAKAWVRQTGNLLTIWD